jgi:hypothetical protein
MVQSVSLVNNDKLLYQRLHHLQVIVRSHLRGALMNTFDSAVPVPNVPDVKKSLSFAFTTVVLREAKLLG